MIRGKVVTSRGRGLPGVRISHLTDIDSGFTMSRTDGHFDFLVNSGNKSVSLKFGKAPFPFQTRTFEVTQNEVQCYLFAHVFVILFFMCSNFRS